MFQILLLRCVLALAILMMPIALCSQTATLQWGDTLRATLDSLLDNPMFLRSQVAIQV